MSTNRSTNLSNKSLASSVSTLPNEQEPPPRFISMEPLSFILSAALEEATQQHPPVSPRTATHIFNHAWRDYLPSTEPLSAKAAEDFLLENDDLSATVHTTAYRLVSTIHRCAAQYSHNMRQSEQRVLKQRNLVAQ